MDIRERVYSPAVDMDEDGEEEGKGGGVGGEGLKVRKSVQERDRGFLLSSGRLKKENEKDR